MPKGEVNEEASELDSSFIGCYKDNRNRDLPTLIKAGYGNPQKCFELGKAGGHKYIGLQYSGECWGGQTYGKYGKRPDSECNMTCKKDPSRKCGAGWRNSIYKID
jgi:hypothetical protein